MTGRSEPIKCDGCNADCWIEGYFLLKAEEDLCSACFKGRKPKPRKGTFEHQRKGVKVEEGGKEKKQPAAKKQKVEQSPS